MMNMMNHRRRLTTRGRSSTTLSNVCRRLINAPIPLLLGSVGVYTCMNYFGSIVHLTNRSIVHDTTKQSAAAKKTTKNYVFGYGSLICPQSRKITNPNLGSAIPVIIDDLERVWSARIRSGYTAMGVNFQTGSKCTGVLVEVATQEEFNDLDQREANYDRKLIDLDNINKVPYLLYNYNDPHPVFDAKQQKQQKTTTKSDTINETDNKMDDDVDVVNVWVYVQREPVFADPSYPIPQSYVDIIMRGCLDVGGNKFAKSFIETTIGWDCGGKHRHHHHHHHHHQKDYYEKQQQQQDQDQSNNFYCWIDDRADPWYVRADPEFSNANKHLIDDILKESIPTAFENRVLHYNPKIE